MSNQNFVFFGNTPIFYHTHIPEQPFFPTKFPNCSSAIILIDGGISKIGAMYAHNGYSVISGRIDGGITCSSDNSNILSPVTLYNLSTKTSGRFRIVIDRGYGVLTGGHLILCGQRYEWDDYIDVIDVNPDTGLPRFYVYADAEVTESRRVIINGIDTGVWREEGRVHEM